MTRVWGPDDHLLHAINNPSNARDVERHVWHHQCVNLRSRARQELGRSSVPLDFAIGRREKHRWSSGRAGCT
eukprot:8605478-Heterocapsa_arctica.AAC.1